MPYTYNDPTKKAREANAAYFTEDIQDGKVFFEKPCPVFFPRDFQVESPAAKLVIDGAGDGSKIKAQDGTYNKNRVTVPFISMTRDNFHLQVNNLCVEGPGFPDPKDFGYDPDGYVNHLFAYAVADSGLIEFNNVKAKGWHAPAFGNLNSGYGNLGLKLTNYTVDRCLEGYGWFATSSQGHAWIEVRGYLAIDVGWPTPGNDVGHGAAGYSSPNCSMDGENITVLNGYRNAFQMIGSEHGDNFKDQRFKNVHIFGDSFAFRSDGLNAIRLEGRNTINTARGGIVGSSSRDARGTFFNCKKPFSVMGSTNPAAYQRFTDCEAEINDGGIRTDGKGSIEFHNLKMIIRNDNRASAAIIGGDDPESTIRGRGVFEKLNPETNKLSWWINPRANKLIDTGSEFIGERPLYGITKAGDSPQVFSSTKFYAATPGLPIVHNHENPNPPVTFQACDFGEGDPAQCPVTRISLSARDHVEPSEFNGALTLPGNAGTVRFLLEATVTELNLPSYAHKINDAWRITFEDGGTFLGGTIEPGESVVVKCEYGHKTIFTP